jgi:hypothetical protein
MAKNHSQDYIRRLNEWINEDDKSILLKKERALLEQRLLGKEYVDIVPFVVRCKKENREKYVRKIRVMFYEIIDKIQRKKYIESKN